MCISILTTCIVASFVLVPVIWHSVFILLLSVLIINYTCNAALFISMGFGLEL